jgi:predicted deacetylase
MLSEFRVLQQDLCFWSLCRRLPAKLQLMLNIFRVLQQLVLWGVFVPPAWEVAARARKTASAAAGTVMLVPVTGAHDREQVRPLLTGFAPAGYSRLREPPVTPASSPEISAP